MERITLQALALLNGLGVARDQPRAVRLFTRAARAGHLIALNMLGRCYDQGWGVAVDKVRAAACFRVAAERGLDWGMYNYATALALGGGVGEDRAAALAWFRRAAALGNAKAMNFVGSFHEDGWACARDPAEAARWYARAAMGGDFRGMFNHARMLATRGQGEEALCWIARAGAAASDGFRVKAAAWLDGCGYPALRSRGRAALLQRAGAC